MLFKIIFIVIICALLFYYFMFDFDFSVSSYFVLLWITLILSILIPSVLSKTEYIKNEGMVLSKDVIRSVFPIKYQIAVSINVSNERKEFYRFYVSETEYDLLEVGDEISVLYNTQKSIWVQIFGLNKYNIEKLEEKSINKKSKNALSEAFRFEKYIEEKHEE